MSEENQLEVSMEEAEKLLSEKGTQKASWSKICLEVKKSGQPVKVINLKSGQIAGGYRAAKEAGLRSAQSYKEGWILIVPASKKTPKQVVEKPSAIPKPPEGSVNIRRVK